MKKRNLTVQLDEDVILLARVLAARRSTSISRLIAGEIQRLVGEDEGYRRASVVALGHLKRSFHLGGGPAAVRDSLHDR